MRRAHALAAAIATLYSAILYAETGEPAALLLAILSLIPLAGWYLAKKASGRYSGGRLD